MKNLKSFALSSLCLASAVALAVTSKPCEPADPPRCTGQGNGDRCGESNVIVISDPEYSAYYYCGGASSPGHCNGGASGSCSELLYKTGYCSHIQCVSQLDGHVVHDYGWCFTSVNDQPYSTGYDCGFQPCPDSPHPYPPVIDGPTAPCNLTIPGYPLALTDCTPL